MIETIVPSIIFPAVIKATPLEIKPIAMASRLSIVISKFIKFPKKMLFYNSLRESIFYYFKLKSYIYISFCPL